MYFGKLEAVQYEEKGEQQESTEQAREYYEKAGEMYSKAHKMDDSDVDSLYNWWVYECGIADYLC